MNGKVKKKLFQIYKTYNFFKYRQEKIVDNTCGVICFIGYLDLSYFKHKTNGSGKLTNYDYKKIYLLVKWMVDQILKIQLNLTENERFLNEGLMKNLTIYLDLISQNYEWKDLVFLLCFIYKTMFETAKLHSQPLLNCNILLSPLCSLQQLETYFLEHSKSFSVLKVI